MILYAYADSTTPSGWRAFTSHKKAKAVRAKQFRKPDRPELMMIDIGPLTHQRAADLLTGADFFLWMKDIA